MTELEMANCENRIMRESLKLARLTDARLSIAIEALDEICMCVLASDTIRIASEALKKIAQEQDTQAPITIPQEPDGDEWPVAVEEQPAYPA